jgi:hypothetical protein
MATTEDLMQRLAVSKKIMERSDQIKGNGGLDTRKINMPVVEDYAPVQASYNVPQEFLAEQNTTKSHHDPTKPLEENRILNSKLPDEIKRLMIEQPIIQPSSMMGSADISEEVIQGAQRLMKMGNNKISDFPEKRNVEQNTKMNVSESSNSNMNISEIKNIIRDVVRDTVRDVVREELKDAGMLVESTQNSNEIIQFKVGQHLFVGKVTKIKKLQK